MRLHPAELDADSLRYLQDVDASGGRGHGGIFIRRQPDAGPRGGWGTYLIVGAVALTIALALFHPIAYERLKVPTRSTLQAALGGLGILCLAAGVVKYLRPKVKPLVGSFLFADARQIWDVTPTAVFTVDLSANSDVEGKHNYKNGAYQGSTFTHRSRDGRTTWTIYGTSKADDLSMYVQVVASLLRSSDPVVIALGKRNPGQLGAVAEQITRYGSNADCSNLPYVANPPQPSFDSSAEPPLVYTWTGAIVRFVIAAVIFGVGCAALPPLNHYLFDEHLFAVIPTSGTDTSDIDWYLFHYPNGRHAAEVGDMRDDRFFARILPTDTEIFTIDYYLDQYPTGRHATDVRAMRDDRLYAQAEQSATKADSPVALRDYLAEPANVRHRNDARKMIAVYYDRTIAELTERKAKDPAKVDKDLFGAMVALLEGMKTAIDPVVTIGFEAVVDPIPKSDEDKEREKLLYSFRLTQEAKLKEIEQKSTQKTAILPYLKAFESEQIVIRERVIQERLTDAVKRAIKAEILALKPVAKGQPPVITIRYHIKPSGMMYTYTINQENGVRDVVGLLRGYSVDWEIVVRPPGTTKEFVVKIASQPLSQLKYDSEPSDPEWAPYAIILYSAFYDLSDRMIRSFAIDPGPSPNSFSFAAAASVKTMDKPNDPFKFQDPFLPKKKSPFDD